MLLDAVKRFFGISGNSSSPANGQETNLDIHLPPTLDDRLNPPRYTVPPDLNQIESEISQIHKIMEQQMQSMMSAFGFTFGSPFSGFNFEGSDDNIWSFSLPAMKPNLPLPSIVPSEPESGPVLEPRDEVLKPQFRSRTAGAGQWDGQDQILDERVTNEGLDSVINEIKPPTVGFNNSFFGGFPSLFGNVIFSNPSESETGHSISRSEVTIYSNVNGHKSVEKIVRLPNGKIERTVISDDGSS